MRRRDFIGIASGVVAGLAIPLRTQAQSVPVIGFLSSRSERNSRHVLAEFRRGMNELGLVEGQNVRIEYRWAEGLYERLPSLAADLVAKKVNVIAATGGSPSALAAKQATSTIPVVFISGSDPVRIGIVESLSKPGANVTGLSIMATELVAKRIEIQRELSPSNSSIAVLVNPRSAAVVHTVSEQALEAGRSMGVQISFVRASTEDELEAGVVSAKGRGLVVSSDPFFDSQSEHLAELTLRHAIPAIHQVREFALAGGLMSYGGSLTDAYRKAGVYVGRILKGEAPAALPVQQSTKVDLVLNLKSARALGLTVPPTLLARADEVIE